ncbi:LysR family transcriptional regulator [Rouxiella sp. Mn2063]|uniref:LysR family transcriptional regulator n=1 Tax=Rouxiella sp. Mn2063 TaxID=3395262 RepID=UPI003BCFDD1A
MAQIRFSLAQIEAFTSVCEAGNLTQAAKRLRKDRTTVSELIEYLELDLGYALFDRSTRPLQLTAAGQRLYRQARLFLQEAEAFNLLAEQIPQQVSQQLTLCYDPFTPRPFLVELTQALHQQGIRLDLLMMERADAELALEKGNADMGIYQAVNRSISEKFKWRAVGAIEFAAYAREGFFPTSTPVPLLSLASSMQLMPFRHLPDPMAKRLQISDHIQIVNELALLQSLLALGQGWAFLPTHLQPQQSPQVVQWDTELGQRGLLHPMVALWKPGAGAELLNIVEQMQQIYGRYESE